MALGWSRCRSLGIHLLGMRRFLGVGVHQLLGVRRTYTPGWSGHRSLGVHLRGGGVRQLLGVRRTYTRTEPPCADFSTQVPTPLGTWVRRSTADPASADFSAPVAPKFSVVWRCHTCARPPRGGCHTGQGTPLLEAALDLVLGTEPSSFRNISGEAVYTRVHHGVG